MIMAADQLSVELDEADIDKVATEIEWESTMKRHQSQLQPQRKQFSEEDCRDFITHVLALDLKLPSTHRYRDGIDEVWRRLMYKFGDANLGRAMGIFNELLEDDDLGGLGLGGDLWRSWRHDFKHINVSAFCDVVPRNNLMVKYQDDLSNPGTPHFPNVILPQPVKPSRMVKDKEKPITPPEPQILPFLHHGEFTQVQQTKKSSSVEQPSTSRHVIKRKDVGSPKQTRPSKPLPSPPMLSNSPNNSCASTQAKSFASLLS